MAPNSPLGQGRGFCLSGSLHWSCLSLSCSLFPWQQMPAVAAIPFPGVIRGASGGLPHCLAQECPPGSCFPEPPPALSHRPGSPVAWHLAGQNSPLASEHPRRGPRPLRPTHQGLRASKGPGIRQLTLWAITTTKAGAGGHHLYPASAPAALPLQAATTMSPVPAHGWRAGGHLPGPRMPHSGGSPRPIEAEEAAQPGGSGGWERRDLRWPPGPLHPRLGRKCGHTHCRNPGAGLGS